MPMVQPDLEAIIRPTVLKTKKYVTSTSNEVRPQTLLDANENSIGSCLALGGHGTASHDGVRDAEESALRFAESLDLHRYPSASRFYWLKRKIASSRGLSEEFENRMTLGIGAADLVDLLIRVACVPTEDAILVTPPTFPVYQVRAALNDVSVFESKLRFCGDDFQLHVPEILDILAQNSNIKLVFLASPGNPTGSLIPLSQIQEILGSPVLRGLVVVDEAYVDFAPEGSKASALCLQEQFPNLVVLQTFSKSHGLAGIRLGTAYTHEFIAEMLQKVQMPFLVSSCTAALASMALDPAHERARRAAVANIAEGRQMLVDAFAGPEFSALRVGPPIGGNAANFVVLPVWARDGPDAVRDTARAKRACEVLLSEHGTAVRCIGDLESCEGCIRVTVGTVDENRQLVEDMTAVFAKG